ncbi:hypothetical protein NBRC10513v2_000141 [Rhodotorula toruloides]|uniref:BY PROTMAP: gi/472587295/gb/EMS24794.1/ cold-shock DNA-binding domain containing protein [Rhodosporidium toruloides NP11] gi/647401222/emb/CDR47306.1/ RHTO0S14e01992g1_1 [Rhodosporidium toruloides] n=1 Tax=Rhodotorula toruloides TaxID=5286 RepID=A0A0K3CA77_RHOTO|nr:Cold-shock' DNA-binding domain-domain containing protein [Rhodotorula toruloides]
MSALDLDLSRLSLASPYPPQGHEHHQAHHGVPSNAHRSQSSSFDRQVDSLSPPPSQSNPSQGTANSSLQPHQIMQPPVHSGPPPHVQLKEPQRRRGVVKFFNSLKGFGFVVDNDPAALGGQEVFCHFSAIAGKSGFRSLAEGEEVEYELVQGPKGFQAANLTGPGGRSVVGDPKARMQKPPAYLSLAPFAMPLGAPYLADPYHAQHAGVYAGSPYTQHVLYVPATASLPPTQYTYAPVPIAAGPPTHRHQPSGSMTGAPSSASTSPFAAPQYQSYASPSPLAGGAAPQSASDGAAGAGGADRYPGMARIGGGGAGAFGAPQQPGAGDLSRGLGGAAGPTFGTVPPHAGPASFSPPGGFVGLPGSPGGPGAGGAGGAGGPSFGGFAPFSPPSFNHAPLFPAPPGDAQAGFASFGSFAPQHQQHPFAAGAGGPPSRGPSASTPSTSALFGTSTASASGTPLPAPIGSRSGTPAAGGRSTPALGNGSLGNDAWKTTAPGSSGGLYVNGE